MNLGKYVPSMDQTIKIAVGLAIIGLLLRYLPIPENIKQLFRI